METVPEGYVTENPTQMVIMHGGVNTITFENRPMTGVIQLAKIDEGNPTVKLSGAVFTITGRRYRSCDAGGFGRGWEREPVCTGWRGCPLEHTPSGRPRPRGVWI